MKNQKPFVVTIAAVSGGGKTTITKKLAETMNNSKALYFDDYEFATQPEDICEWVVKGANYNEWNFASLINDLQKLFEDNTLKYIFIDFPFAYLNKGMTGFIDLAIFIDTPLDIAMARRFLRDYNEASIDIIRNDLSIYLSRGRAAYQEMLKTVKPNSDFIIDGIYPPNIIVDQIVKRLIKEY